MGFKFEGELEDKGILGILPAATAELRALTHAAGSVLEFGIVVPGAGNSADHAVGVLNTNFFDVAILNWLTGGTDWSVVHIHIAVIALEQVINRMARGMRPSLSGDSHGSIVGVVVIVMFGSFLEGS